MPMLNLPFRGMVLQIPTKREHRVCEASFDPIARELMVNVFTCQKLMIHHLPKL